MLPKTVTHLELGQRGEGGHAGDPGFLGPPDHSARITFGCLPAACAEMKSRPLCRDVVERAFEFPLPGNIRAVDEPFRQWVTRAHPEAAPLLWETRPRSNAPEMLLDPDAAATRMSLLPGYLRFVNPPAIEDSAPNSEGITVTVSNAP